MSQAGGSRESSRERLLQELCARHRYFAVIFSFAMVFLLLQIPYLFVLEGNAGIGPVVVLNALGSGAMVLGSGAVLVKCSRRD